MGKLIIPLIIGLLTGISGGGFYAVNKVSATHAVAVANAKKHGVKPEGDSTHAEGAADSTAHVEGEHVAEGHAATPPTGHDSTAAVATAAKPATEATHAAAGEHAAEVRAIPVTAKPATAVAAAPPNASGAASDAETAAHQKRLAKIFATMSPKDASRVLAQMTDHDVSIILGLLSDRQAAAILTNLPAPRAAALSQLQPRRGGGGT